MKIIAAMQARRARRGAPPRAREGGGGSSGWTLPQRIEQELVGQSGHEPGSSHHQPAHCLILEVPDVP
jgi:hypothetical protein